MPAQNTQGAADLVAAFLGGGQIQQKAKTLEQQRLIDARSRIALMDKRVADAVRASQETDAFDSLGSVIKDPLELALIKAGVGSQYASVKRGAGTQQETDLRAAAVERALAGDLEGANANLFGVTNNPVRIADEQGGVVLNPFQRGGGDISVTPVGQSRIDANAASVTQRNAAAAFSDARSDKVRAGDPDKPVDFRLPQNINMRHALVTAGPDGETINRIPEFLRWQLAQSKIDKRYNDGEFALASFLSGINATPPGGSGAVEAFNGQPGAPLPEGDRQVLIDAAKRKIAAGGDPDKVRQILLRYGVDLGSN